MSPELFRPVDGGIELSVAVQPGAGRGEVTGRHGDALKVKVGTPAGGRADAALVAVLADAFGVEASAVTVVDGATGRARRFRVQGVDGDQARAVLDRLLTARDGRPGRR